jgi:hypothetical protein
MFSLLRDEKRMGFFILFSACLVSAHGTTFTCCPNTKYDVVFDIFFDWSVYVWYGGVLAVCIFMLLLNLGVKSRWYHLLGNEAFIKFVDVFKAAVILFLFLQPLSVVDYTCHIPPAMFNLLSSFSVSSLLYPCSAGYWNGTQPATVLSLEQQSAENVICDVQRFSGALWIYFSLLVVWELITLFYFYVRQANVSTMWLVLSASFEFVACIFWGCLELFSKAVFPNSIYWCSITIGTVPIRAFACVHMAIAWCFVTKAIFSRKYGTGAALTAVVSSSIGSSGSSGSKTQSSGKISGLSIPMSSQFHSTSTPLTSSNPPSPSSANKLTPPGTP